MLGQTKQIVPNADEMKKLIEKKQHNSNLINMKIRILNRMQLNNLSIFFLSKRINSLVCLNQQQQQEKNCFKMEKIQMYFCDMYLLKYYGAHAHTYNSFAVRFCGFFFEWLKLCACVHVFAFTTATIWKSISSNKQINGQSTPITWKYIHCDKNHAFVFMFSSVFWSVFEIYSMKFSTIRHPCDSIFVRFQELG